MTRRAKKTEALLKQDSVIIFEAALRYKDFYVRVDVLKKSGKRIELIEVKAKSCDSTKGVPPYLNKSGGLYSGWVSYVEDIAFQTWVAQQCMGKSFTIEPHLMLVDKSCVVSKDGLHQLLRINRSGNSSTVVVANRGLAEEVGKSVLYVFDASQPVQAILSGSADIDAESGLYGKTLPERAQCFAQFLRDKEPSPKDAPIGMGCKNCEFVTDAESAAAGLKSGFDQCWSERLKKRHQPNRTPLFSLWNYRATAGDKLMQDRNVYYLDELKADMTAKMPPRALRQIDSVAGGSKAEIIDQAIGTAIKSWKYPLHFLDFETCAPALPFHRGMRPYQTLGFQFSCHHLHQGGAITHDEFLAFEPGAFPSWDFLKRLKAVLSKDSGTILWYSSHEQTTLKAIRRQILESASDKSGQFQPLPADFDVSEYTTWIDTIAPSNDDAAASKNARSTSDLFKLVKDHYYHLHMGGSNSIKYVLPAVMRESAHLKSLYQSKLTFGTNLQGYTLWQPIDGTTIPQNPYDLLPPISDDIEINYEEEEYNDEGIRTGGAAMMAYASMQYADMPTAERTNMGKALLRYCELDTLAMLMLVQHWKWKLKA